MLFAAALFTRNIKTKQLDSGNIKRNNIKQTYNCDFVSLNEQKMTSKQPKIDKERYQCQLGMK